MSSVRRLFLSGAVVAGAFGCADEETASLVLQLFKPEQVAVGTVFVAATQGVVTREISLDATELFRSCTANRVRVLVQQPTDGTTDVAIVIRTEPALTAALETTVRLPQPQPLPLVLAQGQRLVPVGCAPAGYSPDGGGVDGGATDATGGDDSRSACTVASCDVVEQCGCAADEACDVTYPASGFSGSVACRPVTAQHTHMSPCSGATSCAAGHSCISDRRLCLQWCRDHADCHPRTACRAIEAGGKVFPQLRLCSEACQPLGVSGCPTDWQCQVQQVGRRSFTECVPIGPKMLLDPCQKDRDCGLAMSCITVDAKRRLCLVRCRRTTPVSLCPEGMVCRAMDDPIAVEGVEYGVCAPPPRS